MGGYLYTLAAASVLISLICALVPSSSTQHVKLLCSLCVICLLCAPLGKLMRAVKDGELDLPPEWTEPPAEESEQDMSQVAESLLAGQLQDLLQKEFALAPTECRIYSEWSDAGKVTKITLVLSGKAIWRDPDPIKAYVQGLMGCPCVVVLD